MQNDNQLDLFRVCQQVIDVSDASEEQKKKFGGLLTADGLKTMTVADAQELTDLFIAVQSKMEDMVMDGNDPDALSSYNDMKKFLSDMQYEAEMNALKKSGVKFDDSGEPVEDAIAATEPTTVPQAMDPRWLIDKLAGVAQQ